MWPQPQADGRPSDLGTVTLRCLRVKLTHIYVTGQHTVCQRVKVIATFFTGIKLTLQWREGTRSATAVLPHAQAIKKTMQPMRANIHVFF